MDVYSLKNRSSTGRVKYGLLSSGNLRLCIFFIIKKPSKIIVFEYFENLQKIIVFEGSRIKNLQK